MTNRSIFVLAALAAPFLSGSCSSARICASQQDPHGPLLYEYVVALDPAHTPHPDGYNGSDAHALLGSALGLCGQPVCAADEADARAAFAAAIGDSNLADPALWVGYVGSNVGDGLTGGPAANAAWNAAGAPCYGGVTPLPRNDAGAPCANVGEPCDPFVSGGIDCCPTQQLVSGAPASSLDCEATDINSGSEAGLCQVLSWSPCSDDAQCFQINTPDDQPETCTGGVCCFPEGRGCWSPYIDAETPLGGCCQGLACVPDTLDYPAWWCQ